MPVLVQDYTWSETINEVMIIVPLKGVKPSKVDIFTSSDYVKVRLQWLHLAATSRGRRLISLFLLFNYVLL